MAEIKTTPLSPGQFSDRLKTKCFGLATTRQHSRHNFYYKTDNFYYETAWNKFCNWTECVLLWCIRSWWML